MLPRQGRSRRKDCARATQGSGDYSGARSSAASSPHFCKDCNAEIDDAANTVIALIDAGKLDKAEHAAQAIVERWPDIYDGYDCLGMVCHARGDKQQAVGYYRKVIGFARQDPSLYDAQFEDYYQALISSLEPTGRIGGSAPKPPGYLTPSDDQV